MTNNLLTTAEEYQQKKEFRKAANHYKQYIEELAGYPAEEVYISYSKCLNRSGKQKEAKSILQEGSKVYTESTKILKELYDSYYSSHEREKALLIGRRLIDLEPSISDNYFLLGKACAATGEIEEAKASYMKGLEHKHNMTATQLIQTIEEGLSNDDSQITSEFTFIAGTSNYGAFIHQHKNKSYFTKISKTRRRTRREELFYKELSKDFPFLNEHIPNYINSKIIDDVLYLTIEMIDGVPIKHAKLEDVLTVSQSISSIPYTELTQKYSNPKFPYLVTSPNRLIEYFTQIHRKSYNEKLFTSLFKLFKQRGYPEVTFNVVEDVQKLILDNELYKFIKPEKHYSLVHGDFNRRNSIYMNESQTIKVFDWEFFKIGLHFIDIARFLSINLIPYADVQKVYLNNKELGEKLTLIEKIFFIYSLILLYIISLREKRVTEELETCIIPALEHMTLLVNEYNK